MEAVGQGVGNRIESAREGSFPCQCQSSNQEPVSNPSMRVFALRRPVAFFGLLFVTILAGAKSTSHKLYPNELKGLKFYAKYLAPLRPGVSREEAVRRVLGDTAAAERNGWTIITTYAMKSGPVYNPTLGSLAEIIVRPDTVIPMGAVKFPPSFAHCHTSESEINISFDVYGDRFGLEYWLHEEDSRWGKKGDLYRIVYGPSRPPYPPTTIC
jgi:hypothetical protein